MTPFRLRGYARGYASVTRGTGAVTRVTRKSRVRVHERLSRCEPMKCVFCSIHEAARNRVTHVTTGISRVTVRVTNHLLRNQEGRGD